MPWFRRLAIASRGRLPAACFGGGGAGPSVRRGQSKDSAGLPLLVLAGSLSVAARGTKTWKRGNATCEARSRGESRRSRGWVCMQNGGSLISTIRDAARAFGFRRMRRAILGAPQPQPGSQITLPERPHSDPTRYLSIAAIFKNEAPYLAEWLEFHRLVGVEHIYLYDNGSTDTSAAVLAPFVRDGFVTVTPWPHFDANANTQRHALAHALCAVGPIWRWMAFIDVDEFLFPAAGDSLTEVLEGHEDCQAVAAYWTMFGTSGHETMPEGPVTQNYTMRTTCTDPVLKRLKSIVAPRHVVRVRSAHGFETADGKRPVIARGAIQLNHYYTRSRQEFERKVTRKSFGNPREQEKRQQRFAAVEAECVYDDTIQRFVPALKAQLWRSLEAAP